MKQVCKINVNYSRKGHRHTNENAQNGIQLICIKLVKDAGVFILLRDNIMLLEVSGILNTFKIGQEKNRRTYVG